ncbi:MAG: sporulation protein [Ruminococcaceae bacterium]|jgi:sporulation protein YabP|nr:sporulation protein [Oscillospiraceae bacterium]
MAYEVSSLAPLSHRVQLEGRESLAVSGVEDVVRFDEGYIVMTTCAGTMIVTGSNLHIGKLSLDGGELHVDGHIDAIQYEESAAQRGSLLSRLFG